MSGADMNRDEVSINSADVVVRPDRGPIPAYVLSTSCGPGQLTLANCDQAVAHALAFARHQHVRAWFSNGADEFVLLGTFRTEVEEASSIDDISAPTRDLQPAGVPHARPSRTEQQHPQH